MLDAFRRLFHRGEDRTAPTLLAVTHAVLLGSLEEAEHTATAWATHQRELAQRAEERERQDQAVEWLRDRVMRSPANCWIPSDE
jgi:hypothetical protein